MAQWISEIMSRLGYTGIALLMFLENVFPPIPSELIMPLAGFTAGQGHLSFWGAVLAGTVGSVVGQLPLYYIGQKVGRRRIMGWADRWGKWFTVSGSSIDKATDWLHRHGPLAVFLCRFVPGVRTLISLPAGTAGVNLGLFLLYSTLGMGLWSLALAWAGWLLGENYAAVEQYMGPATWIVVAVLVLAAVMFVTVRRRRAKRSDARAEHQSREPATSVAQGE